MMLLDDIPTPALVLDLDRLEANLAGMADSTRDLGVALRPHIKTHKCIEIAERQRALGARGITVSTLHEAKVFADHGFDDITWAFPLIHSRIDEAKQLAERTRLGVTVDSLETVDVLERSGHPFRVWLKVDSGGARAGVDPTTEHALAVAQRLASSKIVVFEGILTHAGQTYKANTQDGRAAVAETERRVMVEFAERLRTQGIPVPGVSVGSTPGMTAVQRLDGITEARPGNYALFDYVQATLGSCTLRDCAATVLASVISSQPGASHSIVDAGALSLSKDIGPSDPRAPTLGVIFDDYAAGTLMAATKIGYVSQEHGKVDAPLPVGARVRILPNHACLTVAHFQQMYVVRGDEVVDTWRVWNGR
jgi:D-serine deaminase-like pyridoxal phosphate-dependent protein